MTFMITLGKGFRLRFANGWAISVQFGSGNYCDPLPSEPGFLSASSAEVAVFRPDGSWYLPNDVEGWQSPDATAKLISSISNFEAP